MAKSLIRIEGLAIFAASLYFYHRLGASWILFLALWLVPDLSMIGYLQGPRAGAIVYNAIHTYVLAAAVVLIGVAADAPLAIALGTILTSHIAMDRFLGFGLKYPDAFKHTHLQQL